MEKTEIVKAIEQLVDNWKAENEKMKSHYKKVEELEEALGNKQKFEDERVLLLKDRQRLQQCIFDLQNLLIEHGNQNQ